MTFLKILMYLNQHILVVYELFNFCVNDDNYRFMIIDFEDTESMISSVN